MSGNDAGGKDTGGKARLDVQLSCPAPVGTRDRVVLGHGGGGLMTNRLIEDVFLGAFDNPWLGTRHDGAVVPLGTARLAISTDSYVVSPMFFPGGDIGKLALCGTVNDVAMCGARPLYVSAGFILEEGTPIEALRRVVSSMQAVAREVGVQVVTGDTKVVERGRGDQIYINTTGVGLVEAGRQVAPNRVREGDVVLLSGDVGRHGIAVMSAREGVAFETTIESDCAPLASMVQGLFDAGVDVRCLRDCTRGGVASALVEIAEVARVEVEIRDDAWVVEAEVLGACELFGLDPLFIANEGCLVAFVAPEDVAKALAVMRADPAGRHAREVGRVMKAERAEVRLRSSLGTSRVIELLSGEQLPRIC
ncbi:MAG: hydrogenase expression/formation protein HypE [Deltaproteobacteria bacterium]|nr:hydrogenase expression/formation protein HypE [Deltaproteobacteria bacterium]